MAMHSRSGILCAMLVIAVSTITGCSSLGPTESTQFHPSIDGESFSKRKTATATEKSVTELRRQGYFEIGRIKTQQFKRSCDMSGKSCKTIQHKQTTQDMALKTAAKRGGDVVSFSEINLPKTETRYRNGSCIRSHQQQQGRYVPVYETYCTNMGTYDSCSQRQSGSRYETYTVTICDAYEQIPFMVDLEESTGTAWRQDKSNAGKYSKMVNYSKTSQIKDQSSKVGPSQEHADKRALKMIVGGLLGFAAVIFALIL